MAKKLSEIDLYDCKSFLRIDFDLDDYLIEMMLDSAKSYISSYTKLTPEELDNIPEACMCCLVLVAHFYDNRTLESDSDIVNYTISKIMGTHWYYMSTQQLNDLSEE